MFYVFIVNPMSGDKRSEEIIENIHMVCKKRQIEYKIHLTTGIGDATNIAKIYRDKVNHVIYAVGGDGTLSEVLNGLIPTKNYLSLIPAGSGNDFYRTVKEKSEKIFDIDVGKVNDMYFINVASIGIDAEVGANAEIMKEKGVPANKIYNTSIIYTFLKYRNKTLEYNVKNNIKVDKFTLLAICNASFYGGGYNIAPTADLSDGYFDVYFVKKISKLRIPALLLKLKKGKHEESKLIEKKMLRKISLKSKKNIKCCVDGEIIESKKFKFKVKKHAIKYYNDASIVKEILNNLKEN